ncbi:nuclear transport factor 2 family protein [Flavihumibacter sp. R14]|nr:nuclear transport factor 2 family protein [Flavihumibacter soli]
MKTFSIILTISLCIPSLSSIVLAQDPLEAEIRRLEDLEREAVMHTDSAALFNKLWSPKMVINSPANSVGTVEGTKALLRAGGLKYLSFERKIEKITFSDNVAVVMGEEMIRPQGKQPNAGKLVTRRFTNVWQYTNSKWSIIARQATIIKVE